MKTVTKEYKVYKYDELSEKAKEKVRENFGVNYADIQTSIMKESFTYFISENHPYFIEPIFQWSLCCCQGDGLSFECKIDLEVYLIQNKPNMKASVKSALCEAVYNLHSLGNNGRYCYANKNQIDYEYNYQYGKEFPRLYELLDNIVDEIREKYIDVCDELEKQGYSQYEYLYSDEYARETSEANEYEYLENGELF